jgi:cation diffusion facilitator family transporter
VALLRPCLARCHSGAPHAEEAVPREAKIAIYAGAAVNVAMAAGKIAVGSWARSPSLVADGVHSLTDLVSDAVTLAAMRVARIPADEDHQFGHGRAEAIGTLGVSTLLFGASWGILSHSYASLSEMLPWDGKLAAVESSSLSWDVVVQSPAAVAAVTMAVVGVLVKEGLFRWTHAVAEKLSSSTLMANAWHHRSDAMSSVVAVIGAGGSLFGVPLLDPVGGVVVAAMIAQQGVLFGVQALREMSDAAADEATRGAIERSLRAASPQEILSVRRLRTRVMGHYIAAEAEIGVHPSITITAAEALARAATERVRRDCPQVVDLSVAFAAHDSLIDASISPPNPSDASISPPNPTDASSAKERLPRDIERHAIKMVLEQVPQVCQVSHIRLHFLQGGKECVVEAEVELADSRMTIEEACTVVRKVKQVLLQIPEIDFADIHLELPSDRC